MLSRIGTPEIRMRKRLGVKITETWQTFHIRDSYKGNQRAKRQNNPSTPVFEERLAPWQLPRSLSLGGLAWRGRLRGCGAARVFFGLDLDDLSAHLFARLELHHRSLGDWHVGFRRIRISSDAGSTNLHFEHTEVTQFNFITFGQCLSDVVEGLLHYIQNLLLYEAR